MSALKQIRASNLVFSGFIVWLVIFLLDTLQIVTQTTEPQAADVP